MAPAMGSGEEKRVRWRDFLAFLRYSSASFILSILAWPSNVRTKWLLLLAPVAVAGILLRVRVPVFVIVVRVVRVVRVLVADGFFLLVAVVPALLLPGFGPNKASRFASALRL